MLELKVGAVYRHVKTGNLYRLIAVAKHRDDLEEFVVYEALYDNTVGKTWLLPKGEFIGEAKSPDGTFHPRFVMEPSAR